MFVDSSMVAVCTNAFFFSHLNIQTLSLVLSHNCYFLLTYTITFIFSVSSILYNLVHLKKIMYIEQKKKLYVNIGSFQILENYHPKPMLTRWFVWMSFIDFIRFDFSFNDCYCHFAVHNIPQIFLDLLEWCDIFILYLKGKKNKKGRGNKKCVFLHILSMATAKTISSTDSGVFVFIHFCWYKL